MVQLTSAAPMLGAKDVFETAEYYRDVLGFTFDRIDGKPPSFVILDRGGARLMFAQRRDAALPAPDNAIPNVFLYADDVEALAEEFRARGADIVIEPTYRPIWNGKEMTVRDPNGWLLLFGQMMGD